MKVLAAVFAATLLATPAVADGVAWEKDYAAAKARALAEGKLLFIDFETAW